MKKLKMKRGDLVKVTTGNKRDKGKVGEILKVFPEKNRVVIAGVNVVQVHKKPTQVENGGIVAKELSVHISNVSHVDPLTGSATKVGYKVLENGEKVRFAKKSGEVISSKGK